MKSSLKFTAFALLLGGVLHIQSLDAASTEYSLDTLSELSQETGLFSGEQGPRAFAAYVEKLIDTTDKDALKQELIKQISSSSLPISFFEDAQASVTNKPKVKGCLSYCVGAKAGIVSTNEKNHDLIISLQTEINKLSDEIELLQDDVCEAHQQLKSPGVHAFSVISEQSEVVPAETLSTYTVIKPDTSKLSVAEQVYLLKVRSKLASRDELTASLTDLETLLKFRQMIAITCPTTENLERAAFLVDVIPQVRAIAPIIGRYLQSITGDILKTNATATSSGWFSTPQLGPVQTLQLKELEARKNLAYATFDALFGIMAKPSSVPSAVAFTTDPSAVNILVSKVHALHATLPATALSEKLIVKNDGLISVTGVVDYATEVNLALPFMTDLQQLTVDFLKQIFGAQSLLKTTFATSSLLEAADLVQAKTLLSPPSLVPVSIEHYDLDDSEHNVDDESAQKDAPEEEVNTTTSLVTPVISTGSNVTNEEI